MLKRKIGRFWKDCNGSEATETIGVIAVICIFIVCVVMILLYVIQYNAVIYGAKRIARGIEIAGAVDQVKIEEQLAEFIPSHNELGLSIEVEPLSGAFLGGTKQLLQLRDEFCVKVNGEYNLGGFLGIEFSPGLYVAVDGMSEHYWKPYQYQ